MENSETSQSSWFARVRSLIESEKFLIIFALLPFFFSWFFVLAFHYEDEKIKKYSVYSCVNTIYFFLGFLGIWVVSKIPFLGDFLPIIFHFILVLFYLTVSAILIYSYTQQKKMAIGFLENHSEILLSHM